MRFRHALTILIAGGVLCVLPFLTRATDGAGFFEALGEGYGQATTFQLALGDLDGDGDLDAVFANQGSYASRILLNDGTGVFTYTDQRLTGNGHGVGLGDLDGDGDLDVLIDCAYAYGVSKPSVVYLNDGAGNFTNAGVDLGDTALSGNGIQLIDIDGDGDLDAFIAYMTVPEGGFTSRVYLNDGAAGFTLSDDDFPFGTTFADLDLDGDMDAFIEVASVGYRILSNDGTGVFEETWRVDDPTIAFEIHDVAFGDIDADGDIDIFDTNGTWEEALPIRIFVNDGDGTYRLVDAGFPPLKAAWPILADFDGDGRLDAFLSLIADNDQLWLGDGAGGFTDSGVRLGGNNSRGADAGDLDGDGDLDLFVPIYGMIGGPNTVWRNVFSK